MMFGVVKLNRALWVSAAAVVVLVALAVGIGVPVAAAAKPRRLLPIYCVEDEERVAITFDASWGAEKTCGIVDLLESRGVRATFFLTGIWIDAYPDETRYIAAHGMEIGNHSQHHYNMGNMAAEDIALEIDEVNRKIEALTGSTPTVFRAPFGDYGNALIEALDSRKMRCIQWNVDSLDWKGLSAEVLTTRIVDKTTAGSIILCHNNSQHILEALPAVLDALATRYTFVTVSELIADKAGAIDHTGKLHQNP